MAVNAILGTQTQDTLMETVYTGHHGPVMTSKPVKAGNDVLEAGGLVGLDANGDLIPFVKASATLGTGDGSATDFNGTLSAPIEPGSVVITDGTQTLVDDGFGSLSGDGSGTVNYKTGKISASFASAPANGVNVTASTYPKLAGVLAERTDTDNEDVAVVIIHGTVWKDRLSLNDGSDITSDELTILQKNGIYAM